MDDAGRDFEDSARARALRPIRSAAGSPLLLHERRRQLVEAGELRVIGGQRHPGRPENAPEESPTRGVVRPGRTAEDPEPRNQNEKRRPAVTVVLDCFS